MTSRGTPIALATFALASVLSSEGHGKESSFRLSWVRRSNATECLDQLAVESGVRARLGQDPFDRGAGTSIEGTVERGGPGFHAEIDVRDETGRIVGHRVLESGERDCNALGEAVVLAIALTIDPSASLAPRSASPPAPPPPPSAAPEPASEPLPAPVLAVPPPVFAQPLPPMAPSPPAPVPERTRVHLGFALHAAAATGVLPRVSPGASAEGRVEAGPWLGTAGVTWFPDEPTADARFAFGLATLDAGVGAGGTVANGLDVHGLGRLHAGVQHAVIRAVDTLIPLAPGEHGWLGIGLGPRVSVALMAPVRLELGAELVIPIFWKRFEIQGGSGVFESSVGGLFSIGLGFDDR